jgi:hypothetical protein
MKRKIIIVKKNIYINAKDEVSWIEWKKALSDALVESQHTYTVTQKASKIYGVDVKRITVQE